MNLFSSFSIICFFLLGNEIISGQIIHQVTLTAPSDLNKTEEADTRNKHKIVIVGAGAAGISAASLLATNNLTNFLILEASDRIGGRIATAKFGDNIIDYGAQWILGGHGNPVHDVAQPYNVLFTEDDNFDYRTMVSSDINMTHFHELYDLVYSIFDEKKEMSQANGSMTDYFNSRFYPYVEYLGVDKNSADAVKDLLFKLTNAFVGADSLKNAGVLGYSKYSDSDIDGSPYSWKNGFQTFIDILLGKYSRKNIDEIIESRIMYNKEVQNVDWRLTQDKYVVLTCRDGSKIYAEHVIMTVSLGVLKHTINYMFTPQLPEYKLKTIRSLGMGTVEKIFLHFENTWWNDLGFDLSFIWTNEEKEEYRNQSIYGGWPTEIIGFHTIKNQSNLLQGWIVGEAARDMENFSDDIVMTVCSDILKKFIPEIEEIKPINITRSRWHKSEFFYGSYSFATVKSDRLNLFAYDLAEPVCSSENIPIVLFAGEATNPDCYATVHGAVESGWREALRLYLNTNITLN